MLLMWMVQTSQFTVCMFAKTVTVKSQLPSLQQNLRRIYCVVQEQSTGEFRPNNCSDD